MRGTIRVTLHCFSHVKAALGRDSLTLELPAGATAADAERRVRAMAEEKLADLPLRVAVNKEFVDGETSLRDGDEMALIPPVQGG